ncbi:hypothetical protein GW756_05485 [bacterium]|nr:hypothetical protein [bacterium]NCQ55322.1 hypothetical protein [Candidatus Parcubacteria bacterium]NCS67165.1 hypothetical protein [Candidatus Peregrinibacteria bacterium]NCS96791.1 hypothetical protein [bacterium]
MKLHFVGIGGIGTSGLAQLCAHLGHEISGSNLGSNLILEKLKSEGFSNLYDIHDAHNLAPATNLLIYSEAVPPENPERERARELGIPEKSYFEYLGEISKNYQTIAVAGTHGKTTTTGLIAAGLANTDFDATILVGSTLDILEGRNFKAGSNKFLIAEACEYRDNFKFLKPEVLIITNLEWDHADFYKSEEDYFEAFKRIASKSKNVLFHQNDEAVQALLEDVNTNKLSIPAQSPNSWEAILNIWGEANQQNATLALALAYFLKVNTDNFKKGLSHYKGAGRRQEFLGDKKFGSKTIKVYDDYGHHPTEIKATLNAFKSRHPKSKIALFYEPHQYSRTAQFFNEFADAFRYADHCALFPIYEARDTQADKAAVSLADFVEDNPKLKQFSSLDEANLLAKSLNDGDILLFMGAGKISEFAHQFMKS